MPFSTNGSLLWSKIESGFTCSVQSLRKDYFVAARELFAVFGARNFKKLSHKRYLNQKVMHDSWRKHHSERL